MQEEDVLAGTVKIPTDWKVREVTCLATGETLTFETTEEGLTIRLPQSMSGKEQPAPVFRLV